MVVAWPFFVLLCFVFTNLFIGSLYPALRIEYNVLRANFFFFQNASFVRDDDRPAFYISCRVFFTSSKYSALSNDGNDGYM